MQTPPAVGAETLGTTAEASDLNSLAGTDIASSGSYSAPFESFSTSYAPQTVTVEGSGAASSEDAASSGSGWAGLSNATKYAIYAAAGAVALIIIVSSL